MQPIATDTTRSMAELIEMWFGEWRADARGPKEPCIRWG